MPRCGSVLHGNPVLLLLLPDLISLLLPLLEGSVFSLLLKTTGFFMGLGQ